MPQDALTPFKAFERAGWEDIPLQYDEGFGRLTAQSVEPLLDAAGVRTAARVLDVATGPGYVAAAAARRGARTIAVDFSAAMVAEARRRHPGVDFREGDAEALPFGDGSFDAVVMNYGLLHLARPDQAIAEAHRVLVPGGRFAFTVWDKPERAIAFGIVLRAVELCGRMDVALPPGPPFFRFSEAKECVDTLLAAGFRSPQVGTVPQRWILPSGDALFEIMAGGTVRTAGLLREQTRAARTAVREAVCAAAEAYRKDGSIELAMPAVLASALR